MPLKVWNGEPIDYHVCIKSKTELTVFEAKCCKCGENIYFRLLSCAKQMICIDCVMQLPHNAPEQENEPQG